LNKIIIILKKSSKYVALNQKHQVIAEGRTPESTIKKAKKLGIPFAMAWIGEEGKHYVFSPFSKVY